MRRHLLDLVVLFVTARSSRATSPSSQPSLRNVVLHVYVFVIGGLVMLGLVAAAGDAVPRRRRSDFEQALAERPAAAERGRGAAADGARGHARRRRRPTTCTSACCRTCGRSRSAASSDRAARPGPETLGRWWELLRPDRPEPGDRFAPGISQSELRALVADLERMGAWTLEEVGRLSNLLLDEIEKVVVGKRDALELLLLGVLADGHVLIEDYPGLAKTLMARSFAQVASMDFSRIQFTPDLMPADVTGSSIFNQRESDFEFRAGPIFANLLLADEINRAPPKTQAALLEAMQERQVTTEGETRPLGPPFLVLATQNPIEYEGTYPLPEAQLDRFLLRMSVGYPAREDEWQMLANRAERGSDEIVLDAARRPRHAARDAARDRERLRLRSRRPLHGRHRRRDARRPVDPGRRVAARLARAAQALARARRARRPRLRDAGRREGGRGPALAHRLTLRPELWVQRISAEDVVRERLETVPTPAAEDLARA